MKREPRKRRKYFPNNVRALQDTPDAYFVSIPYEDLISWKIHGYEIPDSVYCVFRTRNMETGKVEEHYYNTEHHAKKRLKRSIESGLEITMVSNDGLYHLRPSDTFIDWNF
jgi:hypothetical protein|tara:strand:- start:29860 stop:30192 length:333 start_codon:yes stop_codon:yes gene_type:complete